MDLPSIKKFGTDFASDFHIPSRKLGKTNEKLSIVGFGGIMLNENPQAFANAIVSKAFEMGVNYFDISPLYGNAQDRLGPALKPYRKNSFLACKTRERSAKGASKDLINSLDKLKTDYFDLYQLHELSSVEEVEQAFNRGGAMETLLNAKKEGTIKHIGFSAHSVDAALKAMENYDFDSILFPINFACWNAGDFGPQVFAEAEKRKMGILALKAMALTPLREDEIKPFKNCWYKPIENSEILKLALKYTLSKNITAAIPPGDYTLFLKALEFMKDFSPLTPEEENTLVHLAKNTQPVFRHH